MVEGPQERPHQPRRRKNQRRGNRKSDSCPSGGAKRRLRADARSGARRTHVRLCDFTSRWVINFTDLVAFLLDQEIAKHKLPERLEVVEEFPLSAFGKVSKKDLTERITELIKTEGSR